MSFIARQPNGLLCRYSSDTDCITDYNMTEEDYINLCKEQAAEAAEKEAKSILNYYVRPFSLVKDSFILGNMNEAELKKILKEIEQPIEICRHTQT